MPPISHDMLIVFWLSAVRGSFFLVPAAHSAITVMAQLCDVGHISNVRRAELLRYNLSYGFLFLCSALVRTAAKLHCCIEERFLCDPFAFAFRRQPMGSFRCCRCVKQIPKHGS